ncbi:MAG: hypothetical protein WEB00_12515 [Dehalococcoidia bacterium]
MRKTTPERSKSLSLWYPRGYVFAALDSREAAEQAGRELVELGFKPSEVTIVHPDELGQHVRGAERRRGFLKQFLAAWDTISADDAGAMRRYRLAASQGQESITVRAPSREKSRRAAEVLKRHGGHDIWYYGSLTTEEL